MASLFNICNPLKPPPVRAYVDFHSARGDTKIVPMLHQRIRRAEAHTHLLFSGHPGSGKSTELMRLCELMKRPRGASGAIFPVYMDADDYLSRQDVEIIEILLAIVGLVAQSLRDEANINLESSYFQSRWEELKEFALTPVEMEKVEFSLPSIGKFTTKLKRADVNFRQEVRKKLTPQLPSLLDEINLVLERARVELKKCGYQDLALVIDNLEKIPDVIDQETKQGTYYRVFIVGGEQLSAIDAHTVITIPLPLIHSPQRSSLAQTFGEEPLVLPMVKIEEKNGDLYVDGLQLMQKVLHCRFEIVGSHERDVFDSQDTFEHLCRMNGGHVRNLLIYFRSSSDYVDSLPITKDAVSRGIRQHINAYSRSIPEKNWELLARLHLDPDRYIPSDNDHQEMLGDLSILEYMNASEPWYAVNPVVRELDKFKQALEDAEQDEGETS